MRFRFSAPEADGLRVIPEIPDISLCQIEGRNGIGKSLAARLLELVTGGQPYAAAPDAWQSLRQLGPTTITVDGLPSGDQIEYQLDPASWPKKPLEGLTDSLGQVRINDTPATWADVRRRLKVVRIAGDETLIETIGRTLLEYSVQAGAALGQVTPVVALWDDGLNALKNLASVEPAQLLACQEALARSQTELEASRFRAREAVKEQVRREQIRTLLEAAFDRATRLPDVIGRIERAQTDQESAFAQLEDARRRSAEAAEARGRRADTAKAVTTWERRLVIRSRAQNRARIAEQQALKSLGLESRPSPHEVEARLTDLRREVDDLRTRIEEADIAGTVRTLTRNLEAPLSSAPPAVLNTVVVVTRSGGLSGAQLSDGLRARREQLAGHPRPGEADELIVQERRALHQLHVLEQLPGLMAATDRKGELTNEALVQLRELYGMDGDTADDELSLLEEQARAQDRLVAAGIELAQATDEARGLLGLEPSVPVAETDESDELAEEDRTVSTGDGELPPSAASIRDQWTALNIEASQQLAEASEAELGSLLTHAPAVDALASALAEAEAAANAAIREASEARRKEDAALQDSQLAAHELLDLRLSLGMGVRSLATEPRWSGWLRGVESAFQQTGITLTEALARIDALNVSEEPLSDTELLTAGAFKRLATLAEQIAASAARVRDGLAAIAGNLRTRARGLAPVSAVPTDATQSSGADGADLDVAEAILPWINDELSRMLSTPELLAQLFEGADSVRLNLDRLQVSWRAPDGRPRRRPLEAFSSGEQVFAYTRAKLGQLGSLKDSYEAVVFILDEFGAFVARDRFGQLLSFVRHEALHETADQIVFMLPLAVDYAADSTASALAGPDGDESGADAGSITDRVRQLSDRQYFAIPGGVGP